MENVGSGTFRQRYKCAVCGKIKEVSIVKFEVGPKIRTGG